MTAADQFTDYERDPRAATSCPHSEDMTMNKPFDDKVPAYRAAALELSEAIAIASRIVTKHHPLFEELEEVDLEVGDNPAAFALQGLVIAITEADSVLTAIRDRLGAPEWLSAEEGCAA